VAADTATEHDQLGWEERYRRPAAAAALLAGLLTLGGSYYSLSQLNANAPDIGELQAIAPALNGQFDAAVSPRTAVVQYIHDKASEFLITNFVLGLGTLCIGAALYFLYRATKARRPATPDLVRLTILFGSVVLAVGGFIRQIFLTGNAGDYINGSDRSRDAVDQVFTGGGLGALTYILVAGQLALAFGFILTSLNAMRAGLLTRFMGILGIIVGVLFVIPIASPLPIVQCFWLIALAPLFLGRWPNGTPPAWSTGRAEPWPSQQALREARDRQRFDKDGDGAGAAPHDDAGEPAPAPSPSGSKKRRKRRR
jgi:hypothetical protein